MAPSVLCATICGILLLMVAHTAIDITCVCLGIKYLAYTPVCKSGSTQDNFAWFATIYPGLQIILAARSYENNAAAIRATCAFVLGIIGLSITVVGNDDKGSGCAARDDFLQVYSISNLCVALLALFIYFTITCVCKQPNDDSYSIL